MEGNMEDLQLNSNAYLPLRDVVFGTLREAILKGDLKPGERLMELQLAQKLGVSRTPIREAIRMLEQEGLAVTIPRKGAEVAKMTEKDMEDVLQIREALEILAGRLATEKMTLEQLERLKEGLAAFEAALQTGDVKEIAQTDIDFHDIIYQAADNSKLVGMLNNLREQIYRYRVEYLKEGSSYPRLLREHRLIIEGLEKRDKEYVSTMMQKHMDNQADAVRKIIRKQVTI
jgi:DNA-binding GntR family transcriptional regulator